VAGGCGGGCGGCGGMRRVGMTVSLGPEALVASLRACCWARMRAPLLIMAHRRIGACVGE